MFVSLIYFTYLKLREKIKMILLFCGICLGMHKLILFPFNLLLVNGGFLSAPNPLVKGIYIQSLKQLRILNVILSVPHSVENNNAGQIFIRIISVCIICQEIIVKFTKFFVFYLIMLFTKKVMGVTFSYLKPYYLCHDWCLSRILNLELETWHGNVL